MEDLIITAKTLKLLDSGTGCYFVDEKLLSENLFENIKNASESLETKGPEYILDYFQSYYIILNSVDKIDEEFLYVCLKDIQEALFIFGNNLENLIWKSKLRFSNIGSNLVVLKMLLFAYANFLIQIENRIQGKFDDERINPKTFARSRNSSRNEINKSKVVSQISTILNYDISNMWEPEKIEPCLINLIGEIFWTFLQNPHMKHHNELIESFFDIFGNLMNRYEYLSTFKKRAVQILKNKDNGHLTLILAQGIALLVQNYDLKIIIPEFIREIAQYQSPDINSENKNSKQWSQVLVYLTEQLPDLMIKELMCLIRFLNNECQNLRICILSVLTDVLCSTLNKDGLDPDFQLAKTTFFDQLEIHILDINGNVRAKIMNFWCKLQMQNAIPPEKISRVLGKIGGRLKDKIAAVRKNAIYLITKFIQTNPFSNMLNLEVYKADLEDQLCILKKLTAQRSNRPICDEIVSEKWKKIESTVRQLIVEKEPQILAMGDAKMTLENTNESISNAFKEEKYDEALALYYASLREHEYSILEGFNASEKANYIFQELRSSLDEFNQENIPEYENLDLQIINSKNKYFFLKQVVDFLQEIDRCLPMMHKLLQSSILSDYSEAVDFFVTAYQFKIQDDSNALSYILECLSPNDSERRSVIANAYKKLFLQNQEFQSHYEQVQYVAKQLISLLETTSVCCLENFRGILKEWMDSGVITNEIIEQLWRIFTSEVYNISEADSRAALKLLSLISVERPSIAFRNLRLIAKTSFRPMGDVGLATIACEMLAKIGDMEMSSMENILEMRLPTNDNIWLSLKDFITKKFQLDDCNLVGLIQASINFIYKLCRSPPKLCLKIIQDLHTVMAVGIDNMSSRQLEHFVFALGEIALHTYVFLDTHVYSELKKKYQTSKERLHRRRSRRSHCSVTSRVSSRHSTDNYDDGERAEDVYADFIQKYSDNEIVTKNLLGFYVPLIIEILSHKSSQENLSLQQAASLTMIRYMIVSHKFCKKHIEFIMNEVLEKTRIPGVKINIIVGLADLLKRFPNTIEPWVSHIHKHVHSSCWEVKITALQVLTSLYSNHLVRVKANIAEIAKCITDESPDVVDIVTNFFGKILGQNNNPNNQNILPEVLTYLSEETPSVNKGQFLKIIQFLLGYIDGKAAEMLIDKLCVRLNIITNRRYILNIARCLANVRHTHKTVERLIHNYHLYKMHLENEDFFNILVGITENNGKISTTSIKNSIRRFDDLLKTGEIINSADVDWGFKV